MPRNPADDPSWLPGLCAFVLLAQNFAVGKSLPWASLPWGLGRMLWLAATFIFVTFLVARPPARAARGIENAWERIRSSNWLIPGLMLGNAAYSLLSFLRFKPFGYAFPWPHLVLCLTGAVLLRRPSLIRACAFSLALLVASIFVFPIHPGRSDMLFVIAEAFKVWRSGGELYRPMSFSFGTTGMFYLPLTFFSHLPAWWLGLDLRWNQFFYRALWMAILLWRSRDGRTDSRWSDVAQLFILSPYFNFRHDLYFEAFFVLLAGWSTWPRLRWLLAPAAVACRQWAWVLFPFWALREARTRGWVRAATQHLLGFALVIGLVTWLIGSGTPAAVVVKGMFPTHMFLGYAQYDKDYGLTLAPVLFWLNAFSWVQALQAALVLGFGVAALRTRSRERIGLLGLSALSAFVLLNMHFWIYFWLTPVFACMMEFI